MTSVAVTFLLWLAGLSCLWPLAQQSERVSGVVMESNILISETNESPRDATTSTIQWINNQTTYPNPGGNKKKVILKRIHKKRKSRQKVQSVSSNLCGDLCCPGWSRAPNTGACTRAICTPKCKNRGVCTKPQECVCKVGFEGSRCERRSPPLIPSPAPLAGVSVTTSPSIRAEAEAISEDMSIATSSPRPFISSLLSADSMDRPTSPAPTNTAQKSGDDPMIPSQAKNTSLNWRPLTVQELQSILHRKGLAKKDKMAALLAKHLETQKSQTAKEIWKERHREPNSLRTAKGEYNILRQIQTNGECITRSETSEVYTVSSNNMEGQAVVNLACLLPEAANQKTTPPPGLNTEGEGVSSFDRPPQAEQRKMRLHGLLYPKPSAPPHSTSPYSGHQLRGR